MLRKYSIAHTVNTWGRPRPEEQVAVAHAVGNFWQLAGKLLEKMRRDPDADGWMQYGIRKQKDLPEVVTDSYLHSMMMAGIVAAHETTANAGANAIKLLLQHPHAWQDLCDDPRLIPNAVEECLRHNGSVAAWRRVATRDVEIEGVDIPAGSKLLIVTSSANHDERAFADADLFDIRRENANDHLTFGYGSHQCMGKNLARMEIQVFLQADAAPAAPEARRAALQLRRQHLVRGPEHLWVEWDPAKNPERTAPAVLEKPRRCGSASRRSATSPARCRSSASRQRPTASSGCAWSRPTAASWRVGRRARTSTSSAATPACRGSTPCAEIRPTPRGWRSRCCARPRAAAARPGCTARFGPETGCT
jgi:hypothetical protein